MLAYVHIILLLFKRGPAVVEKMRNANRSTVVFIVGIVILLIFLGVMSSMNQPPTCESCHVQGIPTVAPGVEPKLPNGHPPLPPEPVKSSDAGGGK